MNHHNSVLRMAHEYAASKEAFERLTQIMCTEVSIPVSDRYNAVYGEEDLHHSLTLLSAENRYAESGMKRLAIEASSARVPSGSWVRDAVSSLSESDVTEKVGRALDSTMIELRRFGVFNEPVVCAMDKHQIPRYDEGMESFLTRGKQKAGTMKFETYATLQCVEEGKRAQIACAHVGILDDNADVIAGLLEQARLREAEVSLLLLDREFFSASCMARLEKGGQRYLMPCKLTRRTKEAIRECAQGKRRRVSRCTITSDGGEGGRLQHRHPPKERMRERGGPSEEVRRVRDEHPQAVRDVEREEAPGRLQEEVGHRDGICGSRGIQGEDDEQEPCAETVVLLLCSDTLQRVAPRKPDHGEEVLQDPGRTDHPGAGSQGRDPRHRGRLIRQRIAKSGERWR